MVTSSGMMFSFVPRVDGPDRNHHRLHRRQPAARDLMDARDRHPGSSDGVRGGVRTGCMAAFADDRNPEGVRARGTRTARHAELPDIVGRTLVQTEDTDAPVFKLLQTLFKDAVQVGASDIHIEPDEKVLRIRMRIDGVLQEQIMNEKRVAPALVLRLKLMAGLDISEKRLPQDGRFNIKVKDKSIDARVSTLPVSFGEAVVMRLLDQSGGALNLEQIGMPAEILRRCSPPDPSSARHGVSHRSDR